MLFNSFEFILLFLPITVLGFYFLRKFIHKQLAICWLLTCSLFFYGYWNPRYLILILSSIAFNYSLSIFISKSRYSRYFLYFGVVINLILIGYFKYTNFLINSINNIAHTNWNINNIVLPLAISFFTLQQIAYLVDIYNKKIKVGNFLDYSLFVTFFPQLIAGPIVHYKELAFQFNRREIFDVNLSSFKIGLTIFVFGLFKKVVLADNLSLVSSPLFELASQDLTLTFLESWIAAISYTFQLYFDFSGYSDMAIGSARMLGIILPINFYSPYISVNIREFWRRWHITLSNFLRDYLYIPLGGNRQGKLTQYRNLLITMSLGGLWHGAGWTFIIWGILHGLYLMIHNIWEILELKIIKLTHESQLLSKQSSIILTFMVVAIAWVYFRADSLHTANSIIKSMLGLNGFTILPTIIHYLSLKTLIISVSCVIVFYFPNTYQILHKYNPSLNLKQQPKQQIHQWSINSNKYAFLLGLMLAISFSCMSSPSEFLYFDF